MGISFALEGRSLEAEPGDTVASALLRSGIRVFSRGPKYHRPRGPFCFAGSCAQCHMRIGGEPNVPSCQTPVTEGLQVERQNALGSADNDLLRAVDFLYPEGIDHHHLMTHFKVLNVVTKAIARRLAGFGELPSHVMQAAPARMSRHGLVVIGAGPAGLAAARAAGGALVLEADNGVGGHIAQGFSAYESLTPAALARWCEEIRASGGEITLHTRALGLYEEGGARYVLARTPAGLWQIQAERVVLATGGYERSSPFEANDLPGVFAGRGLLRLIRQHGVRPGERAVVLGSHRDARIVAMGLRGAGVEVSGMVDPQGRLAPVEGIPWFAAEPLRALGRSQVRGLVIADRDGHKSTLRCDHIAVVAARAPAYELAAEVGAQAHFYGTAGGFVLMEGMQPRIPWLIAAGDVTGAADPVASGRAAGGSLRAAQ